MACNLPHHLPDFRHAKILVCGDLMLDQYCFGGSERISPEAPVPIVKMHGIDSRPGGAANVACNLAMLGAQVSLVGLVGDDAAGEILQEKLQQAGVQCHLSVIPGAPTITKQRVISNNQQLLRLDTEAMWGRAFLPESLPLLAHHIANVDLVILSDYGKGTLNDPQILIKLAKAYAVPVLVDPKGVNFAIYAHATILTPNFHEFTAVVGSCHTETEIVARAQELRESLALTALLLTRGAQGMTLISATETMHLAADAHEVYDVTGAGDTVISVLGASVALGIAIPQAVALANLAAGIVVTKLGTATVLPSELNDALTAKSAALLSDRSGIISIEELLAIRAKLRLHGKSLVFTNGCFDMLHAGHVTYLQHAKALGDYLVVAINNDLTVARAKGPGRPVNTQEQRAMLLAALRCVDWVVIFNEDTPEVLLQLLQPEVLVKGSDYTIDQVVGADIVTAYGGTVSVAPGVADLSTTTLLERYRMKHNELR